MLRVKEIVFANSENNFLYKHFPYYLKFSGALKKMRLTSNLRSSCFCLFSIFYWVYYQTTQSLKIMVFSLSCHLEIDGKLLLLKKTHTLVKEHGEIKPVIPGSCNHIGYLSVCEVLCVLPVREIWSLILISS